MIEVAQITKNPIPEADILSIFQSLCEAVGVFHKHEPPIAHRDIKVICRANQWTGFYMVGTSVIERANISNNHVVNPF